MKTSHTPAATYNFKEWMQGLGEDASKADVRNYKTNNHGTGQKNACSQPMGRSRRWHGRQGAPQLLTDTSRSPSLGGGVHIGEVSGVPTNWPD